jgi:hypothetical protein
MRRLWRHTIGRCDALEAREAEETATALLAASQAALAVATAEPSTTCPVCRERDIDAGAVALVGGVLRAVCRVCAVLGATEQVIEAAACHDHRTAGA